MGETRPEQVKCVATGYEGETVSWCGRRLYEFAWHFMDASHAALNGRANGRLVACQTASRPSRLRCGEIQDDETAGCKTN